MDNDSVRAGAIILRNLRLFDQATLFFERKLDVALSEAVDLHVRSWLDQHGWRGQTKVTSSFEDLWVCPPAWMESEDDPFATFELRPQSDKSDSFELADLCGVGSTHYGFRFVVKHSWFGGKSGWNSALKNLQAQIDAISNAGWISEGRGMFFRPVQLSPDKLASAWETDDWSGALAPLTTEFEFMAANQKVFDTLIMKAKPRK